MSKFSTFKPGYSRIIFNEPFTSVKSVSDNGGTITGATIDNGSAKFTTTSDAISYPSDFIYEKTELTFVIRFTPTFDTDADQVYVIFEADSDDYELRKKQNSGSNELRLRLGGALIADIAEATYSPYWKVDEENLIVISGATGDTSVWLNNNLILDGDASAWSPVTPTTFYIGNNNALGTGFDGRFHEFYIMDSVVTSEEAKDIFEQDTYSELERPVINLPLRSNYEDGSGNRVTENKGSADGTATLGDGTTITTFPTQLSPHGNSTDGGDYLDLGTCPTTNTNQIFTIGGLFTLVAGAYHPLISSSNASTAGFELRMEAGAVYAYIWSSSGNYEGRYTATNYLNGKHTIFVTYDGSLAAAGMTIYVDGEEITSTPASAGTLIASAITNNLFVGKNTASSFAGSGIEWREPFLYSNELTPSQARKLHFSLIQGLNI
jgi:hypothetical protein